MPRITGYNSTLIAVTPLSTPWLRSELAADPRYAATGGDPRLAATRLAALVRSGICRGSRRVASGGWPVGLRHPPGPARPQPKARPHAKAGAGAVRRCCGVSQ
jgi:hypothetical protein